MLCEFVAPGRGATPTMGVPTGPNIQEHRGGTAPVRTYQDLLTSAYDESLFDYYATSQLPLWTRPAVSAPLSAPRRSS